MLCREIVCEFIASEVPLTDDPDFDLLLPPLFGHEIVHLFLVHQILQPHLILAQEGVDLSLGESHARVHLLLMSTEFELALRDEVHVVGLVPHMVDHLVVGVVILLHVQVEGVEVLLLHLPEEVVVLHPVDSLLDFLLFGELDDGLEYLLLQDDELAERVTDDAGLAIILGVLHESQFPEGVSPLHLSHLDVEVHHERGLVGDLGHHSQLVFILQILGLLLMMLGHVFF